ncbi:hypothetical protein SAMN00790413_06078 [Deinococcus hopiensis KR-140]|uniref:Uncharacterized protein n=1 Tax=Deinococcus hopiensis KR-140 TaxID=695939 RepID=A0A1W1VW45_9DEIO|nr:hypothetical protein SAMN00790413_06078 [Deinococcus hopiensis KR-140]
MGPPEPGINLSVWLMALYDLTLMHGGQAPPLGFTAS